MVCSYTATRPGAPYRILRGMSPKGVYKQQVARVVFESGRQTRRFAAQDSSTRHPQAVRGVSSPRYIHTSKRSSPSEPANISNKRNTWSLIKALCASLFGIPNHSLSVGTTPQSKLKARLIRKSKLSMAQTILNYRFKNEDLLWEALQAHGTNAVVMNGRMLLQGNKGLATVGDAVATLVVKQHCYMMNLSIGDTSEIMQKTVSNCRFAHICDETGLTACINRDSKGPDGISAGIRADTVEAVIGAVFQDGGLDNAQLAMRALQIIEYD